MAQQFNDLVYRYPQGQGPKNLGSALGGKGLLSDPGGIRDLAKNWGGIKIMPDPGFSGGFGGAANSNQGSPGRRPPHNQGSPGRRPPHGQQAGQMNRGMAQMRPQVPQAQAVGNPQQGGAMGSYLGGMEQLSNTPWGNQAGAMADRINSSMFGNDNRMQQPNPQQAQDWNSLPQGEQNKYFQQGGAPDWAQRDRDPGFQMQPRPMQPQTGGGFIAGNPQPMGYNPQQAAPQAPSQRDPAAVAARQAQRQQYLQRMGR